MHYVIWTSFCMHFSTWMVVSWCFSPFHEVWHYLLCKRQTLYKSYVPIKFKRRSCNLPLNWNPFFIACINLGLLLTYSLCPVNGTYVSSPSPLNPKFCTLGCALIWHFASEGRRPQTGLDLGPYWGLPSAIHPDLLSPFGKFLGGSRLEDVTVMGKAVIPR